MIYNERQFKITGSQIKNLERSLASLSSDDKPELLHTAQVEALRSQLSELTAQLVEYKLVKDGNIRFFECSDLSSLPRILIQARISKGLSQKEFAEKLGVSAQQIQRYESSEYMGASLSRLVEISELLEISITEAWGASSTSSGDSVFVWNNFDSIDWNMFPIKEMIKKGWVKLEHGVSPIQSVMSYFSSAAGPQFATALHRKKFHGENRPNEHSLLAWQARVLEKSRKEFDSGVVQEFSYEDSWLKELVEISREDDAPLIAKQVLASKGIILVIEEHLQGTYLDGAAMLLETGNPVIGLTLRYDRLDNFWFVLFHEIAHVYLHLFESLNMDFFDEEGGGEADVIEQEADNYALENLLPNSKWDLCLSRFNLNGDAVLTDAENYNVHPSIIAGRIRKEQNNYTIFNELMGQGAVRRCFGAE